MNLYQFTVCPKGEYGILCGVVEAENKKEASKLVKSFLKHDKINDVDDQLEWMLSRGNWEPEIKLLDLKTDVKTPIIIGSYFE